MWCSRVIVLVRISRVTAVFLIFFLQVFLPSHGLEFGYDGVEGPSYWGERYRECTGKHQSPININILQVKNVRLPPMEMIGFDDPIDNVHVSNNGHTVLIEVENEPHPMVRGGPLDGTYVFSQMHFHWGDNDTFGSEDTINHKSFPMELHMVFYKSAYGSPKEAVRHSDGLTVLAFFYELDRHRHPAYDDITEALGNVTEAETDVHMKNPFSILHILPYDLSRYFTYRGSLTTPPCSEVVIWIDFEQPIRLEHAQIDAFRELKSATGKIRHNFRPLQPVGDRIVFYNADTYFLYNNELDATDPPTRTRKKWNKGAANFIPVNSILILVFSILLLKCS